MPDEEATPQQLPLQDSLSFSSATEREEFWQAAVLEQAESGLSARAFCTAQGLPISSFHHWKRTLKKREEAGDTQAAPIKQVEKVPSLPFAEVRLSPAAHRPANSGIEIRHGDFILRLQPDCDRDLLREVLCLLGEVSC